MQDVPLDCCFMGEDCIRPKPVPLPPAACLPPSQRSRAASPTETEVPSRITALTQVQRESPGTSEIFLRVNPNTNFMSFFSCQTLTGWKERREVSQSLSDPTAPVIYAPLWKCHCHSRMCLSDSISKELPGAVSKESIYQRS